MLNIQGVISDFTQKAVELLSSLKVRNKLKMYVARLNVKGVLFGG